MIRIAFDIGGTFTDFVLHDADRKIVRFGKALTTPRNLEQAVLEGVDAILAAHGASSTGVASVLHATTIATNAILERKGSRTALVTTAGFRDTTDYFATGYELDLVANVSKNFRLRGNFAVPKTELTHSIPGLRRYFDLHIAEWQAAASNPATQGQTSVITDIQNLRNRIDSSADHRRLDARHHDRADRLSGLCDVVRGAGQCSSASGRGLA